MEQVTTTSKSRMNDKLPLWKIEEQYYLPILAVCFSASEIHNLTRENSSNHKRTFCFVELMETLISQITKNKGLADAVQTQLDSKYRLTVKRFDELSCETDIRRLWNSYWESGEFRGAFWAIMQNSLLTRNFKAKILQQVEITSLRHCCTVLKEKRSCCPPNKEIGFFNGQSKELEIKCQQIKELESKLFLKEYQVDKLERHLALYSIHTPSPL